MKNAHVPEEELEKLRAKLALPNNLSQDERESYYICCAVDNRRRARKHITIIDQGTPGAETELSYELACYSSVIKELYSKRNDRFNKPAEVLNLILSVARTILGGDELTRNNKGVSKRRVDNAVTCFTSELAKRLNNPLIYDPVETVALIEYRLRYAKHFFEKADRLISEAMGAFFLMRGELECGYSLRLPDYGERDKLNAASEKLPSTRRIKTGQAINEMVKSLSVLSNTKSLSHKDGRTS